MKLTPPVFALCLVLTCCGAVSAQTKPVTKEIPNRLIDYPGFAKIVNQSGQIRERKRLTEADFLKAMREKNVVILDARTDKRYDMLHLRGAVNLPFTEFTAENLAKVIPTKKTKVLIYCNDNFLGDTEAFASKFAGASLNLSTFTSLMTYGYSNIYELGPLLNVRTARLPFDGAHARIWKALAVTSSTNWHAKLEDRTVHYKYVRNEQGPDGSFAVFQRITGEAAQNTPTVRRPDAGGFPRAPEAFQSAPDAFARYDGLGILLEEANAPGKYVFGLTNRDLHGYLHSKKNVGIAKS